MAASVKREVLRDVHLTVCSPDITSVSALIPIKNLLESRPADFETWIDWMLLCHGTSVAGTACTVH